MALHHFKQLISHQLRTQLFYRGPLQSSPKFVRYAVNSEKQDVFSTQKCHRSTCGGCKPPPKNVPKCKSSQPPCGPQCPSAEDFPRPPCPYPTRPPQPDRCKEKFKMKKIGVCAGPCPRPSTGRCDENNEPPCKD